MDIGCVNDGTGELRERCSCIIVGLLTRRIDDGVVFIRVVAANEKITREVWRSRARKRSIGERDSVRIPWRLKRWFLS
jgi:hypothetical protein